MKRKKLYDPDTPLFDDAPTPAPSRTLLASCTVCGTTITIPRGLFVPPLCHDCTANPQATLDQLEHQIIALEEAKHAAWQPILEVLDRCPNRVYLSYEKLWRLRGTDSAAANAYLHDLRDNPAMHPIFTAEAQHLRHLLTTLKHADPKLAQYREAQADLLGLRAAKGWQPPSDCTERRAALAGQRRPQVELAA